MSETNVWSPPQVKRFHNRSLQMHLNGDKMLQMKSILKFHWDGASKNCNLPIEMKELVDEALRNGISVEIQFIEKDPLFKFKPAYDFEHAELLCQFYEGQVEEYYGTDELAES